MTVLYLAHPIAGDDVHADLYARIAELLEEAGYGVTQGTPVDTIDREYLSAMDVDPDEEGLHRLLMSNSADSGAPLVSPEEVEALTADMQRFGIYLKSMDEAVYERDIRLVSSASAVVAEVSVPSTGVGYELGTARYMRKATICLFDGTRGKRLSSMVNGNYSIFTIVYNGEDYIAEAVEAVVTRLKEMGHMP